MLFRSYVEDGHALGRLGMWWVHLLFLALAIALLLWNNGQPLGKLGLRSSDRDEEDGYASA